jgi:phospholipid-binding lipoprotein MlaA
MVWSMIFCGAFMIKRLKNIVTLIAVSTALSACSTANTGDVADPIEGVNRGIFKFNDAVDTAVIKPVAQEYHDNIPKPARIGVRNFLRNLKTPTQVANNLLQGNVYSAGDDLTRFFANTFFGLGGTVDVAGSEGVTYKEEDFGQTLGTWGVGNGAYVVLPLLGSSTVRDTTGLLIDGYADPIRMWTSNTDREALYYSRIAVTAVDKRESLLGVLDDLKRNSIDYYATTKSAYIQNRENLVHNNSGNDDLPDMP